MKLPSEIKVLNHVYKVIEVDEITADDSEKDPSLNEGGDFLGLIDDTTLQILIVKHLQPSRKAQVFLHEVVHAIFNIIDIRRWMKDPEAEESLVNIVSDILLQILSDNSDTLKFHKKYKNAKVENDPSMVQNIINNLKNNVPIADICRTFQITEADVKKIMKLHDIKGIIVHTNEDTKDKKSRKPEKKKKVSKK